MKEKLYAIPVNDAFDEECECPVCVMYRELEKDALRLTMSGVMVEERRMESNKTGFCQKHAAMLYEMEGRTGLAWLFKTHMDQVISEIEQKQGAPAKKQLFKKQAESSPLLEYIGYLNQSCYVCDHIWRTFQNYLHTICHLYKKEEAFREKFKASKGFCVKHYGMLYQMAQSKLNGAVLEQFVTDLDRVCLENLKRVRDDLSWFIDKFDYRYKDEPWKNSKDALPRTMTKLDSIL